MNPATHIYSLDRQTPVSGEFVCVEARGASPLEVARRLEAAGWDLASVEVEPGSPAEKLIDELNKAGMLDDVLYRLEGVAGVKTIVVAGEEAEDIVVLEPGEICATSGEVLERALRDAGAKFGGE